MRDAIQVFAIINLLVMGLSHALQPRAWAELFVRVVGQGRPGAMGVGGLHLLFGAIIVAGHAVWSGVPTLLTILGWGWTLKGALYLWFPEVGLRSMARVDPEKPRGFVVAGLVMITVGAILGWSRFFAA
jgi:hypothetical protein